jgi:ParB/RepB/Spo0J family partition protein
MPKKKADPRVKALVQQRLTAETRGRDAKLNAQLAKTLKIPTENSEGETSVTETPETLETDVPDTSLNNETSKSPAEESFETTPNNDPIIGGASLITVALNKLVPNKNWNREKLVGVDQLAQSIKACGLAHLINVCPIEDREGYYEIQEGHRRHAALQKLEMTDVMVCVVPRRTTGDYDMLAAAENNCRVSNNPFELAKAFQRAIDEGKTMTEIAKSQGGKSPGWVSQILGILRTPDHVQRAIRDDKVPASITRVLLRLKYDEDQVFYDKTFGQVLEGKLSIEDAGLEIDNYLARKEAKEKGQTSKKTAAKTKATKKRGRAIQIPDYSDPELLKKMAPRPKKDAHTYLLEYAGKLQETNDRVMSAHFQGILAGIELSYGLRGED